MLKIIPTSKAGESRGINTLVEVINRHRNHILCVVKLADDVNETVFFFALFKEPGSIGQITVFINEDGIATGYRGAGSHYHQRMMECLASNQIELMELDHNLETYQEIYPELINELRTKTLSQRLELWQGFLLNEVVSKIKTQSWSDVWSF